jgi:hypothetical protein
MILCINEYYAAIYCGVASELYVNWKANSYNKAYDLPKPK